MAFSMFSKLWRQEVEDRMFSEPDQLRAIWEALQLLRSEAWMETHPLGHAVTQPWRHPTPGWYDAAALNEVGVLLGTGLLVYRTVPVGAVPGRDREVAVNNDRLANLPSGFAAEFIGAHGDDDGTFEWDRSGGVARWPYRSEQIVLLIWTGTWAGGSTDPVGKRIDRTPPVMRVAGRRVIDDLQPSAEERASTQSTAPR